MVMSCPEIGLHINVNKNQDDTNATMNHYIIESLTSSISNSTESYHFQTGLHFVNRIPDCARYHTLQRVVIFVVHLVFAML